MKWKQVHVNTMQQGVKCPDRIALYQNSAGFFLVSRRVKGQLLWELRDAEGSVLASQYELPLGIDGPPTSWATTELTVRNLA